MTNKLTSKYTASQKDPHNFETTGRARDLPVMDQEAGAYLEHWIRHK